MKNLQKSPFSIVEPVAPMLSNRRLASWFFPGSALVMVGFLTWGGIQIGVPIKPALAWLFFILACLALGTFLSSPLLPLRLYRRYITRSHRARPYLMSISFQNILANVRLTQKLKFNRHKSIWICYFFANAAVWASILYLGISGQATDSRLEFLSLLFFLYIYSIILMGLLVNEAVEHIAWGQNRWIWLVFASISPGLIGLSLFMLAANWQLAIIGLMILLGCNWSVYTALRLGIGAKVIHQKMQQLSRDLLSGLDSDKYFDDVPEQVEKYFRYGRVAYLEPTPDHKFMVIKGQHGDYADFRGQSFPIDKSITGRVFLTGRPDAWNDVNKCKYYERLDPEKNDTQAEAAVPVRHEGHVFGVLDIQSKQARVYGPGDVQVLQTLGEVLGAALAARRADLVLKESIQISQELREAWQDNEQSVFEEFARFAIDTLGGSLVIYYPLSSSGFPTRRPFLEGEFYFKELMHSPITDMGSPLIRLIKGWKPVFVEKVDQESILSNPNPGPNPNFVAREGVLSACFLPIGAKKEPLGVLFLNFRRFTKFDPLFQATLLSFSGVFSTVAARIRYQDFFYQSFGRPELGIHNIKGRHLFKGSVVSQGRKVTEDCSNCNGSSSLEGIYKLLGQLECFVDEVTLAEATIPPNFSNKTLLQVLEDVRANLPPRAEGPRPEVNIQNIDRRIERENILFKLAIYRLVTEAINNAVIHGNAALIDVSIQREPHQILIEVMSNGKPLSEDSEANQSKRGIYFLLAEFKRVFNAQTTIRSGADNCGTHVRVSIPCLPTS
jgi:hypothetical protein